MDRCILSINFASVKHISYSAIFGISVLTLLLATGCHQKGSAGSQDGDKSDSSRNSRDSTQQAFFPVGEFLMSEIGYVDSTPLAIRKYTIQSDRRDSAFIQPADFNGLAREFILPELDPDSMKINYLENSFQDETTGYLTLNYTPRNKEASLQRVDVIITPGKTHNKVRSIYMEKLSRKSDTLEIKKMYWQAQQSFQVITTLQLPEKAPIVRQLKVVWDTE
jgi:hypothetical protein